MADYVYNPTTQTLIDDHPRNVVFHQEFWNCIHICTCQHTQDNSKPVLIEHMRQDTTYQIFAQFEDVEADTIPAELKVLLLLAGINI